MLKSSVSFNNCVTLFGKLSTPSPLLQIVPPSSSLLAQLCHGYQTRLYTSSGPWTENAKTANAQLHKCLKLSHVAFWSV